MNTCQKCKGYHYQERVKNLGDCTWDWHYVVCDMCNGNSKPDPNYQGPPYFVPTPEFKVARIHNTKIVIGGFETYKAARQWLDTKLANDELSAEPFMYFIVNEHYQTVAA